MTRSERLQQMLESSKNGENIARRNALAKTIKERLYNEYGTKSSVSNPKEIINTQVRRLMDRCYRSKISEVHLQELEDTVRKLLMVDNEAPIASTARSYESSVVSTDRSIKPKPNVEELASKYNMPTDSYTVLMEASLVQHKEIQERERAAERKKQEDMRKTLDELMVDKKNRKLKEKQDERAYAQAVRKKVQEYEAEEKAKKMRELAQNKQNKKLFDDQFKREQIRKKKISDRNKREDLAVVKAAQRELELEKERQRQNMLTQQRYMNQVKADNERIRQEKIEMRKREWQEDAERNKEYTRRLMMEDEKRMLNLQKMKARSANNQKMYLVANEDARLAEEKLEKQIEDFHQAKIARQQAELIQEEERRAQDKRDMYATLSSQLEAHERERQAELDISNKFAQKYKEDARVAEELEKKRQQERRQRNINHKKELLKQAESYKYAEDVTDPVKMTADEKALNASEMRRILSNQQYASKVQQRMIQRTNFNKVGNKSRSLNAKPTGRKAVRPDYYSY